MGTIKQHFEADVFQFRSASAFPTYVKADGTSFPVTGLAFDATTEQTAYVRCRMLNYGGTGLVTALFGWYADTATSGGIAIGASMAAMTANGDVADVETKAFAAETIITDTHLGTVGQRPHDVAGTIAANDSVGGDDWCWFRIARKVADAGDTMTGFMILTMLDISYSDT
jgi:hypothetical protein